MVEADHSAESPLTFGRYEALFHIASGGMAEVFAARLSGPAGFEKLVAVKRLLPTLSEPHFVDMFLDEARLAANIASPHVVQTLELGRAADDGALYIVMELIVGVTLFELCVNVLEDGPGEVPVPMVVEIVAQAADGLHDAHNATTPTGQKLHVVHRDVSPQNLLLGIDGRVRVTDFGIARAVSRSTQTQVGQLKGKVAYLSPEQARGQPLDRRSDVFALGVVAWEALTGRSLFNTGDAPSTLRRVKEIPIPSPRELRKDTPKKVADAVLWALERDLHRRCPDARTFGRALREAMPSRPGPSEVAEFVKEFGGVPLHRMRNRIAEVHAGADRTVMRPPPERSQARIIPDAEPEQRVFGQTEAGQRRSSQPARASGSKRPKRARVSDNSPEGRSKRPRDPTRPNPARTAIVRGRGSSGFWRHFQGLSRIPVGAAIALGALAWLSAAVLAWYLFSGTRQEGEAPPTIAPIGASQ